MGARSVLLQLTPPAVVNGYRRLRASLRGERPAAGFFGDYGSWAEATAASTGYDSADILQKTRAALIEVRDGRAAYERDSVLFEEVEYSWPLATALLRTAALNGGMLNVLDFGGSLGSSYFQNRTLLEGLRSVRWNVVEQPEHVRVGTEEFESDQLRFYATIDECAQDTTPNVVVLGSVLQYLERPHETFAALAGLPLDCIVLDRTPFIGAPKDRLCVQQVDRGVYDATYPCWLLSSSRFHETVEQAGFRSVAEFSAIDTLTGPVPLKYRGLIVERNTRTQTPEGGPK